MGKKYRCCSYCDSTEHKNFHGYQIGDEEETPHKKKGKSKTTKRYKGCPERDGKAHIYVWIEMRGKTFRYSGGTNKMVDSIWWEKRCVGCDHKTNRIFPWGWGTPGQPTEIYEVRNVDHDYFW